MPIVEKESRRRRVGAEVGEEGEVGRSLVFGAELDQG